MYAYTKTYPALPCIFTHKCVFIHKYMYAYVYTWTRGFFTHMYIYMCMEIHIDTRLLQIATKYSEFMTPNALIKLFEEHKCMEGLYYYLGAIVNFSTVCPRTCI